MKVESSSEFGKITYLKSKKANSIRITIKPFYGVKVTIPWYVSYDRAKNVILSKSEWISKNLLKMKEIENGYTIFDFDSKYLTRQHKLHIKKYDGTIPKIRIAYGKINVLLPRNVDTKNPDIQNMIRVGIERAWRNEGQEYLPNRVNELAVEYNFSYQKVSVRNSKTRWGSCSAKNNINLSLHLMNLPDHLIDHVILHELCHTVQKNHGKEFWILLESVSENARLLSKELNKYRIGIY